MKSVAQKIRANKSGIGLLILFTLIWLGYNSIGRPSSVEEIQNLIANCGAFAPIVYVCAYTLRPFLLFPAIILNISSSLLFGPYWGTVYLMLGGLGGATVCFLGAKIFGKQWTDKITNKWWHKIAGELTGERSFEKMLWLRLVPIFPYDPVSCLAGLAKMKYIPYALATTIGMLPGAIAYNMLTDCVYSNNPRQIFGAALVMCCAFGLPYYFWRYKASS